MTTYIQGVTAFCEQHGDVRVVMGRYTAMCEQCLQLARAGRLDEVLSATSDGGIRGPELLIYPEQPINYIEITFRKESPNE